MQSVPLEPLPQTVRNALQGFAHELSQSKRSDACVHSNATKWMVN